MRWVAEVRAPRKRTAVAAPFVVVNDDPEEAMRIFATVLGVAPEWVGMRKEK